MQSTGQMEEEGPGHGGKARRVCSREQPRREGVQEGVQEK